MVLTNAANASQIKKLISAFELKDGASRQRARQGLVLVGRDVIPFLIDYILDHNDRVRWEVAKTLEELKDPTAASALVMLLGDDVPGIRWLAGEGLINLKDNALIPLLKGLQVNFHSRFFLEGAHHVLRELEREGLLNNKMLEALSALEGAVPTFSVPFAAAEALQSIVKSRTSGQHRVAERLGG